MHFADAFTGSGVMQDPKKVEIGPFDATFASPVPLSIHPQISGTRFLQTHLRLPRCRQPRSGRASGCRVQKSVPPARHRPECQQRSRIPWFQPCLQNWSALSVPVSGSFDAAHPLDPFRSCAHSRGFFGPGWFEAIRALFKVYRLPVQQDDADCVTESNRRDGQQLNTYMKARSA